MAIPWNPSATQANQQAMARSYALQSVRATQSGVLGNSYTFNGVPEQVGHASAASPLDESAAKALLRLHHKEVSDRLENTRELMARQINDGYEAFRRLGLLEGNIGSSIAPQKPADAPSPAPARCTPIFGDSSLSDLRKGVLACWDEWRPAGF